MKKTAATAATTAATAMVLCAGAALGLAASAAAENPEPSGPLADPNALGTYVFDAEDGESATWTVTPCAEDSLHCVNVAETGNGMRAPWSANAYWAVGSWTLFVDQPDAILCTDGSTAPGVNTYSWDATNLTGNASIASGGACGIEPQVLNIPFGLAKTGGPVLPLAPAEAPVPPPYVVEIPPPYEPNTLDTQQVETAPAPALPAESGPAAPVVTPPPSDALTPAELAEPGFNAR